MPGLSHYNTKRRRRDKCVALKLCINCGQPKEDPSIVRCALCNKKHTEYCREYNRKKAIRKLGGSNKGGKS